MKPMFVGLLSVGLLSVGLFVLGGFCLDPIKRLDDLLRQANMELNNNSSLLIHLASLMKYNLIFQIVWCFFNFHSNHSPLSTHHLSLPVTISAHSDERALDFLQRIKLSELLFFTFLNNGGHH